MSEETFLNSIEGTINDVFDGMVERDEAVKSIVVLFTETLKPVAKTKEHLELFIYRVSKMRELQQQFFAGNKTVIGEAKKCEGLVDNAIKKLITEFGYDIEKLKQKYEQKKLFANK